MSVNDTYLDEESLGFIFIGPSGAGKTTLRDSILKTTIGGHSFVQYRPHTSRLKRPNENDEYYFVNDSELDEIERTSKILFRNEYHGNKFLTTWPKKLGLNEHYLYIYSPPGALNMKKQFSNHKIIQILPDPTISLEDVLLKRDPMMSESELKRRTEIIPREIEDGEKIADTIFINERGLERSVKELVKLISAYL